MDSPDVDDVAEFRSDTEKSIRHFYSAALSGTVDEKFAGYSPEELNNERDERLLMLDQTCGFLVLAALEASFRTDFHARCSRRLKDELSRHFRSLHRRRGKHISFEDGILNGWRKHSPSGGPLLSDLKAALKYRHWFAHGRYYQPKLGRKYDFFSLYALGRMIHEVLPLER